MVIYPDGEFLVRGSGRRRVDADGNPVGGFVFGGNRGVGRRGLGCEGYAESVELLDYAFGAATEDGALAEDFFVLSEDLGHGYGRRGGCLHQARIACSLRLRELPLWNFLEFCG